ncbi:MAG: [FeFe] hydrogenase H-cluster radical SAM maturase HydG [Endomicrobiales bacterium]
MPGKRYTMRYIDENMIEQLLGEAKKASPQDIDAVLEKAKSLQRLSLTETAALLAVEAPELKRRIFGAAAFVKEAIYGKRVVLFAPLYTSNLCSNNCLYCAFRAGNNEVKRKKLSREEIKAQVEWLLKRGHKRLLVVAGETAAGEENTDDYVEAIQTIYSAQVGPHRIKRVNINCAPLSVDQFKRLKSAGIGTFQVFQETYHEKTYREVHPSGPKSDPDNRIDAVDRDFTAGIDDVGIGALYGLHDWKFEILAMLMHVEHLEKKFNVGPHTISVPRIEPATGVEFTKHLPHQVSDEDFKRIVAILRLAVPYTGIILSTRETAAMRDELFALGVSQVSAESRTSPGGYSSGDDNDESQFSLNDHRTLDEIIGSLMEKGMIPSFCAACYRKERTGEAFMNLAKPGTIKGMCSMNALVTLKEYLDDFASEKVKREGYALIDKAKGLLDDTGRQWLCGLLEEVAKGARDKYV